MRHVTIALTALIAGVCALSAVGEAAPGPALSAAGVTSQTGMTHEVQLFPRRYYRNHPYAVPPAAVVVTPPPVVVPAPVVPGAVPLVEGVPVVVVPLRPASCGEFHYWNGVACVDARYNNPYIGPR
jgi:hypothetical protein